MNTLPIPLLAGFATVAVGGGALLLHRERVGRRRARQRLLDKLHGVAAGEEANRAGAEPLRGPLGRVGELVASKRGRRTLQEELARAGYHGDAAAAIYLGTKMSLLVLGLLGFGLLILSSGLSLGLGGFVTALAAACLFFAPNLWVAFRRERRRGEIVQHLPDSVDLLDICVSAGMGIDMAWTSVSDEIRRVSVTLADEMELTNLEINLGVPRALAMRHMAERTGVEDISSLVALLVQSERFGASIVEALRTFAKTMRESRSQRAEEAAEKMSVKLLFPMVVFIFPALLIVMVGPATIELFKAMGA